ncbi:MAG: hypothetical protein M3081_02025 [Gemmatimonadota bacterium]|nr:hypothetical protein [Gemmatimonadota bacterium]
MRAAIGFGLVMTLGLGACNWGSGGSLSDAVYISTMAELRVVEVDTTLTPAARAAARTAVLAKHGVRPDQLEATAQNLAKDADHAIAVWKAIDVKLTQQPAQPKAARPPL